MSFIQLLDTVLGTVATLVAPAYSSLDPTEGGAMRASLSARYATEHLRVLGYGVRNQLDLFSNFTFFARDQVDGDQIEQTDDRWLGGATGREPEAVARVRAGELPDVLRQRRRRAASRCTTRPSALSRCARAASAIAPATTTAR